MGRVSRVQEMVLVLGKGGYALLVVALALFPFSFILLRKKTLVPGGRKFDGKECVLRAVRGWDG